MPAHLCGIKVVGTPFGHPEFIAEFARELFLKHDKLHEGIIKMPSLQSSWLLLYYCAVPRINFLLRTLPPPVSNSIAILHDSRIFSLLCKVFSIPLESNFDADLHGVTFSLVRRQAQLPLRYGGLGLRSCVRTAPAAYWSSWADSICILRDRFPSIFELGVHMLIAPDSVLMHS